MDQDIRTFLKGFSLDKLKTPGGLGILCLFRDRFGDRYLLRKESVRPLITLMKEHNITRLTAMDRNWFLTSDGKFTNPGSPSTKWGNIADLKNPGDIFRTQNPHLNPYYSQSVQESPSDEADEDDEDDQAELVSTGQMVDEPQIKFGLERDLQRFLRANIAQLDTGLRIVDGGVEQTVESGRIDITAADDRGNLVIIELKAGTATPEAVAQILGYMGAIENPDGRPIRGILVANDFHPRVVYAAKAVPTLSLKAYSFQFSFEDR